MQNLSHIGGPKRRGHLIAKVDMPLVVQLGDCCQGGGEICPFMGSDSRIELVLPEVLVARGQKWPRLLTVRDGLLPLSGIAGTFCSHKPALPLPGLMVDLCTPLTGLFHSKCEHQLAISAEVGVGNRIACREIGE